MSAVEINRGKVRFTILITSKDEVVVERVLLISALIAQSSQIVSILLDRISNIIIMQICLSAKLFQLSSSFLEIGELSGSCDDKSIRDLFKSVHTLIFLIERLVLSNPPYERRVSVAMMTPSLHFNPMTAPPVT